MVRGGGRRRWGFRRWRRVRTSKEAELEGSGDVVVRFGHCARKGTSGFRVFGRFFKTLAADEMMDVSISSVPANSKIVGV